MQTARPAPRTFAPILALCLGLGALMAAAPAMAERVYVYGNSLVHHPEEERTNVPYWLARLAEVGGRELALDGQWGFLRDFTSEPAEPNWSVYGVTGLGEGGAGAVDAAIVAPTNFIQYQPADADYEGGGTSPLDATLALVDRIAAEAPEARVLIYEGWADMGPFLRRFPPTERGLARYHAFNEGEYHAWYDDYLAMLREARPDTRFGLIPIAPILSELMSAAPLDALDAEAFYLDDAPHGTEETYFLAALVVYAVLFDAPPPEGFAPPDTLAPELAGAYPEIAATVRERVRGLTGSDAAARPAGPEPEAEETDAALRDASLPERREIALPPKGARPDGAPALAMGLNGIADWTTEQPFLDIMKTAREWIGHLPGQWGGVSAAELRAGGHLDENGWPRRIPEGVERLETFVLTDQPEDADYLRGTYVLRYEGKGDVALSGRAGRVYQRPGEIRFHYTPGEGPVGVVLNATDPEDPVRDITIVRESFLRLHEVGEIFNPDWIGRIRDVRSVRFMDWMLTNGSTVSGWNDRPRLSDYTWSAWGVPLPVMVALANRIGADPWFNMPHKADDDYVRRFAETVRDTLDPRLKAYVEYSNEVWNGIFPQHRWAAAEAEARWGESGDGWAQFYALRAAQMMDIWTQVFGDAADQRLARVVAVHTGWPGLEEAMLDAPLAYLALGRMPREAFDAYAVSGYFGYELGDPEWDGPLDAWLDAAEARARAAGEEEGLSRVALREYVRANRFGAAFPAAAQAVRDGSLAELTDELLPYHAEVARDAGLDLVMYEGGTHAAARGEAMEDERLTGFLSEFSYSPEMASLYQEVLDDWVALGGRMFNAFVDVAAPSKWGSWGALRHLDDSNPRWDVLMAHNATAPVDWEDRDPAAFENGVVRVAGAGGARIEGTAEEDVMLGGDGADTFVTGGGSDHVHGGGGTDRAIFPGRRADYEISTQGEKRVVALRDGRDRSILVSVEELRFSDEPEADRPSN